MNLYKEILIRLLENKNVEVKFSDINEDITKIAELECYKALEKIKAVIEDDSLDDKDCLDEIISIIAKFEIIK